MSDASNNPRLKSWCESAQGSDFPIQNLPLGIFSVGERRRQAGVAIGDYVLDLGGIAELLDEGWREDLSQPVLNGWLARGHEAQSALRQRLQELLSDEKYRDAVAGVLSRTLDHFSVPAREKGEVLSAFAAHKNEVTKGWRDAQAKAG